MEIIIKPFGVEVKYNVPADLAEAIAWTGSSEEAVYKAFLKQVLYHSSFGNIRSTLSDLLESKGIGTRKSYSGKQEVTQEDREVDGKTVKVWVDGNGKQLTEAKAEAVTTETDAQFFGRVCAENEVEPKSYANLIQEAANANPFDPSKRERSSAEKKANKTHLKIATEIADNGALERVAAQLAGLLGREVDVTSEDRDANINALALAIGENERNEAEARKNKYLTMGG